MFIGREKELSIIENRINSNRFEFGILYGRRRIGKTTLLKQIVKSKNALYFVANSMGLEYNLKQLSQSIAAYFNEPITFEDFESIFKYLAKRSHDQKIIFILDEFTYLMDSNDKILTIIQNSIDQYLIDTSVCLIISGSHVGMIEDALTYQKPLYGRSTFKLKLEAFDYYEASKFYPNVTSIDKIRLYSVFGGVPFYISRIDPNQSVRDNIINLIIETGAIFEDEINFFLSQEVRSQSSYGRILNAIASGSTRVNEISTKAGNIPSGQLVSYLNVLINLGIIEKDICFGSNDQSRKTLYRIKDPLFRFHYTFIERNKSQKAIMNASLFYDQYIETKLDEFIALEFESIAQRFLIIKHSGQLERIGRYWANDARARIDIEIDIVASIKDKLIAYECKWTNSPVDLQIVNQLREKAKYLSIENLGFFSKNKFTADVYKTNYLLYTIDDLYSSLINI
jgi:AAA+ ATPase superfamily predicted ATPase